MQIYSNSAFNNDILVACDVDTGDKLITFSSEIDDKLITGDENWSYVTLTSEPVFLNVYGAQESIPRNEFR
jgi:hypothetical protein